MRSERNQQHGQIKRQVGVSCSPAPSVTGDPNHPVHKQEEGGWDDVEEEKENSEATRMTPMAGNRKSRKSEMPAAGTVAIIARAVNSGCRSNEFRAASPHNKVGTAKTQTPSLKATMPRPRVVS